MKKSYCIALLFSLLIAVPAIQAAPVSHDPVKEKVANMTEKQREARAEEIRQRVYEIRDMDKSDLSRADKKALRKELKGLKKEARAVKGVFISFGALIIIILLLILIL